MAIEIKELVVRATIKDAEQTSGGLKKAELIKECVDQVMELLKERQER